MRSELGEGVRSELGEGVRSELGEGYGIELEHNILNFLCVFTLVSYATPTHTLYAQFLTKNPTRRLGCQPGIGERQIKGHAFFRSINWEKLEKREVPAPFRPQVV